MRDASHTLFRVSYFLLLLLLIAAMVVKLQWLVRWTRRGADILGQAKQAINIIMHYTAEFSIAICTSIWFLGEKKKPCLLTCGELSFLFHESWSKLTIMIMEVKCCTHYTHKSGLLISRGLQGAWTTTVDVEGKQDHWSVQVMEAESSLDVCSCICHRFPSITNLFVHNTDICWKCKMH